MRRIAMLICMCSLILSFVIAAEAVTTTLRPSNSDLWDLEHNYYYGWGINFTAPNGLVIKEAVLTFKNITNWDNKPNVLFTHLINTPRQIGTYRGTDTDNAMKDYWNTAGPLIGEFHDTNGSGNKQNLVYTFSALDLLDDLNTFTADGKFGLVFDPDCHFYNDGVELEITTGGLTFVTPEPTGLLSLLGGVGFIPLIRRRKA